MKRFTYKSHTLRDTGFDSQVPLPFYMINASEFPDYAKFINSLRCPLCGSQLDGNCHPNGSQLYCILDNEEYKCGWMFGCDEPTYEDIRHTFSQYQYLIKSKRKAPNTYNTIIFRYNMDYVPRLRHHSIIEMFSIIGPRLLFFRTRMDEKSFSNKLKLYSVFS